MQFTKKPLLDVIFASDKRKNVLLLLKSGPKEMGFILNYLNTSRQALLPQIRILEEHHLIDKQDDNYELTDIGKLIVDEMAPLLSTLDVLDVDIDYWATRNLDFIPPHLLKRINELGACERITPSISEMYEIHDKFYEISRKSTSYFAITAAFFPNSTKLLHELVSNNVHIYVIMSNDLFDKQRTNNDTGFKELVNSKFTHFFVYQENIDFISWMYNDYCIMMSPLRSDGGFDNKHFRCCNQNALIWARNFFEHYLNFSTPVTEM
ncbi:transcriptional regulator [Methanolobus halotolerans]|uniref:Transcriptional regulator n=2 Tax=Methanolobus halotolerans TaxID=2052935 RepID=A0A4E0QYG8_9EURY|nr:transcriptional regulator [Methanolobus halotolerans]